MRGDVCPCERVAKRTRDKRFIAIRGKASEIVREGECCGEALRAKPGLSMYASGVGGNRLRVEVPYVSFDASGVGVTLIINASHARAEGKA